MTPDAPMSKIFVPARLIGGLVALVAGALVCVYAVEASGSLVALLSHGLTLTGVGVLLAIIGASIALTARVDGCAPCHQAFEDTFTMFLLEHRNYVAQAISVLPSDGGRALLAMQAAPFSPHSAPNKASVEVEYCPKCQALGRVRLATRKTLPDGALVAEDYSPATAMRGATVQAVVRMVNERNYARQMVAL